MARANPNNPEKDLSITEVCGEVLEPGISLDLKKQLRINDDTVLGLYNGASEYESGADVYLLGLTQEYTTEDLEEFGELARSSDIIVPRPAYQDLYHEKLHELDFSAEDIIESGWGKINGQSAKYFRISITQSK